MIISLLIFLLISNAVSLWRDKSTLFSRMVITSLLFASFITPWFLTTLICIILTIIILKLVYKNFKSVFIVAIYLSFLSGYLPYSIKYGSLVTSLTTIVLSLLTFKIMHRNIKEIETNNETSLLDKIFIFLVYLTKEKVLFTLAMIFLIKTFRSDIMFLLGAPEFNLISERFVYFSLLIPFIILGRMLSNVYTLIKMTSVPTAYIVLVLFVEQLCNADNYRINNIKLNKFVLLCYIAAPFLDHLLYLIYPVINYYVNDEITICSIYL